MSSVSSGGDGRGKRIITGMNLESEVISISKF
jgi:hypothetical protein